MTIMKKARDAGRRVCFPTPGGDSAKKRIVFRVDPADIAYTVMIIEAHDYIAIPRTIDPVRGIMEALCPPDFHPEASSLIQGMAEESIVIEIILS